MRIAINKIHFPVTALGHGRRLGIWTQGCSIRCPGCVSRDTWEPDPARLIEIDDLLSGVEPWLNEADGVTISGGEPFDQPDALRALLGALRQRSAGDILVYSGYAHSHLNARFGDILRWVDLLISEPFVAGASDRLALRGSDNQRCWLLTERARRLYSATLNEDAWPETRRMDVVIDDESAVWMAGIPRRGEMETMLARLATMGYECAASRDPRPVIRA